MLIPYWACLCAGVRIPGDADAATYVRQHARDLRSLAARHLDISVDSGVPRAACLQFMLDAVAAEVESVGMAGSAACPRRKPAAKQKRPPDVIPVQRNATAPGPGTQAKGKANRGRGLLEGGGKRLLGLQKKSSSSSSSSSTSSLSSSTSWL